MLGSTPAPGVAGGSLASRNLVARMHAQAAVYPVRTIVFREGAKNIAPGRARSRIPLRNEALP